MPTEIPNCGSVHPKRESNLLGSPLHSAVDRSSYSSWARSMDERPFRAQTKCYEISFPRKDISSSRIWISSRGRRRNQNEKHAWRAKNGRFIRLDLSPCRTPPLDWEVVGDDVQYLYSYVVPQSIHSVSSRNNS